MLGGELIIRGGPWLKALPSLDLSFPACEMGRGRAHWNQW